MSFKLCWVKDFIPIFINGNNLNKLRKRSLTKNSKKIF